MKKNPSPKRKTIMETTLINHRGALMVIFALVLLVLLGFLALTIDVGMWYLARAEISKSVDAGALAGAKNITNPNVDPLVLAEQFSQANFSAGYLGTPTGGSGIVAFNAFYVTPSNPNQNKSIQVNGTVNAFIYLSQLFGVNQVVVSDSGAAQKNNVQIMLVLDRSGSMAGQPEIDLQNAALNFLSYFQNTQADDQMGLVTFATSVTVTSPLGYNFINSMTTAINSMTATGATNSEDAMAAAGDVSRGGLPDQTGIPGNQRVQQFVIFFTDGWPTAFRGKFKNNGVNNIDAVVCGTGNTCGTVYGNMGNPSSETWMNINPSSTGDGNASGTSCGPGTTEWYVFSQYPVNGNSNPTQCKVSQSILAPYICNTAIAMLENNAQTLKNQGVLIYVIGLGGNGGVNQTVLQAVASTPTSEFYYYTPTSSQLQSIFNAIAKDILLRLTQ
jgi:Mg-chelatase subunit ChlD